MKPILETLNLEAFGRDFLAHYVQGGFGRMPKRDIDLLVVYLLIEHGSLDEHSDWELAQLLHTTPTRIRNLRADARFLYWDDARREAHIRQSFFGALANEAFTVSGTTITVQVPDPFVRQALKAALMDNHKLMDTSFNGALLKMGPDGFAVLFSRLLDHQQREVLGKDPRTRQALPELSDKVRGALVTVAKDGARTLNRGALIALSQAALTHGNALVQWVVGAL